MHHSGPLAPAIAATHGYTLAFAVAPALLGLGAILAVVLLPSRRRLTELRNAAAGGYTVTAPQFPESSLADDVARLRQVLDRQDGPAIVAGHSYGGQIMTALGADAPNVVGLVYIAAFGLDEGESIGGLLAQGGPPTPALAHLEIDKQGFAWVPENDFVYHFAAGIDVVKHGSCTPCSSLWPYPRSRT